jgi:hypothetical protein
MDDEGNAAILDSLSKLHVGGAKIYLEGVGWAVGLVGVECVGGGGW